MLRIFIFNVLCSGVVVWCLSSSCLSWFFELEAIKDWVKLHVNFFDGINLPNCIIPFVKLGQMLGQRSLVHSQHLVYLTVDDEIDHREFITGQHFACSQLLIHFYHELLIEFSQPEVELFSCFGVLWTGRLLGTKDLHCQSADELARVATNFSEEVALNGIDCILLFFVAESLGGTFIGLQNPLIEYKTRSDNLIFSLREHGNLHCWIYVLVRFLHILLC